MEMAKEYGLNHMGENNYNEDEDDDDEGNAAAPPTPMPPAAPEEIIEEEAPVEMVPEPEAPVVHEVILVDAESELLQPRLFNMFLRDYKESTLRMANGPHELNDLDDVDNPTEADYDMDEWIPKDGSSD
jgi:hypothetical protein